MSTDSPDPNCQKLLTTLEQTLAPFLQELAGKAIDTASSLNIALDPTQMALLAAFWERSERQVVWIVPASEFEAIKNQLHAWMKLTNQSSPWIFLPYALSEQESEGNIHTEASSNWHQFLAAVASGTPYQALISTQALTESLPDPRQYHQHLLTYTLQQRLSLQQLIEALIAAGYVRHQQAIEPGGFRVRGEQVDIQHPLSPHIFTLTFFGNVIEQMTTQLGQRTASKKHITLPPLTFPSEKIAWENLRTSVLVSPATQSIPQSQLLIHIGPSPSTDLEFPIISTDSPDLSAQPGHLFIAYEERQRLETIQQSLQKEMPAEQITSCFHPELSHLPLQLHTADWLLRTEASYYPPQKTTSSPISLERAQELIGELKVGKPAVHADHGVAIYEGLQSRTIGGITKEYLILRYAAGDSLSVPVEFAHKVTPYIGESTPAIHRLHGTAWQKTKKKAQADAIQFAKELLTISKKRHQAARSRHVIHPEIEQQLNESFPFELTSDQERTWQEILTDLQTPHPMDRLVVGDVGFGKTELAIRAARHLVAGGYQVAVLAPTTLLVQQHFDTFQERLPDIKNSIHLLSRFISSKEQKQTRTSIENGQASIVIGTHALFSAQTKWQKLGLVIIDEEQRFGVKQKEHFKKLRASVDILSLSATPIPRTLSMALSGLRGLSVISTPPPGRKSVKTIVKKHDPELLTNVINRELKRGGQIYVVAPKIRHLGSIKEELASLAPAARIQIAHGQLPDDQLSRIIHNFDAGAIDILVSSSIVENGLDLPNANTMIIWHAPHFGLAELYQLRGRVGRRQRQGYAYFLYNQHKLTAIQRERLTALTEASRLGSGWELARRDLEIRGAGNLLGAEQSGAVNSIGVSLYLEMVRDAIAEEEDATAPALTDIDIQLPLDTYLPTFYIAHEQERTRWYSRLTRAKSITDVEKLTHDLQQAHGQLPDPAANFVLQLHLAHAARPLGVTSITSETVTPPDEDPYHRLIFTTTDPKPALAKLQPLGNWEVRNYTLTWDVDGITPSLVQQLTSALS